MGVSTETEQALRVEMRDLLLVICVDGHLIEELPSGFHAAVGIVRGEEDAVDTDRVRHAQIALVRQIPALIYRTRLLVHVLTTEHSAVEVLPHVLFDCTFQAAILIWRKSVIRPPRRPTQYFKIMASDDLQRRKPVEHPTQDEADAVYPGVDVPTESRD